MTKKRVLVVILALALMSTAFAAYTISAQTRVYRFDYEYAKIWINDDGTIDLFYNISITLLSGRQISEIDIGQPNRDFSGAEAFDQYGRQLVTFDASSGNNALVTVILEEPLTEGNSIWFTLLTNVGRMIYPDETNPGNLGMQFTPAWRVDVPIEEVRIQIVMPQGVPVEEVKTTADKFWNSTSIEPDGRLALYWETMNLAANMQYTIGVSFPQQYLPGYTAPPQEDDIDIVTIGLVLGIIGLVSVIIAAAFLSSRKKPYQSPKVSMESLGIRRGLTAIEASYLLGFKPTQIVTEILYSLLQKRAVWVEAVKPTLKLRIMPAYADKKGPDENPLRYYEIDFLEAVNSDGTLIEEKLANAVMSVRDTLEAKLKGYSRKETEEYYRKIVDKAWAQVEQAGTPDIASNAYDEQLLWLMMDPNYKARTETTFRTYAFEPSPLWFWYWYGYVYYMPRPAYQPNVNTPSQSPKPPTIPGAEFANNIATTLEQTSSNIVANIERFIDAIVPPPPQAKTSHDPSKHGANCVCACAACACACACVSCACACAGGGVRIK